MWGNYSKKGRGSGGFEIEDSILTVTQKEESIIEVPLRRRAIMWLWWGMFLMLVFIVARAGYLNVLHGQYYSELSKGNRIRSLAVKAPRGKIMDKFGTVLALNVPSMDVIVIPRDLPEEFFVRQKETESLADILNLEKSNLEAQFESLNRKSMESVLIKENISQDQALIISEKTRYLPGIGIEYTAIRNYENSFMFSSVIGYDGKITHEELSANKGYLMTDYIGKTGIEKQYEKELKGKNGTKQVEVDSLGNVQRDLGIIDPESGSDLILSLDEGLQKKVYDSLSSALQRSETRTGAAVAINPQNGGVLVSVSFPAYDNNLFARGISNSNYQGLVNDGGFPLLNRVANGEYPPGSTLKPIVAIAAISEGVITPATIIDGLGGSLNIGNFSFGDWKAHGPSDVRRAIAESNDIFFYTVGGGYGSIEGLGMSRMKKYENLFGLGSSTGIDLPSESQGFIPSESWKLESFKERWYVGDSYHSAIGQGFITATPLQLANYVAAMANGGILYVPRIVNKIKKNGEEENYQAPAIIRKDFIDQSVLKVAREGMRQTVTEGTAQSLQSVPVEVAGKTGTAQFGTEEKVHSWFISFAPFDNPEIAMAVLVEGAEGEHSPAVAVTREALGWYFRKDK